MRHTAIRQDQLRSPLPELAGPVDGTTASQEQADPDRLEYWADQAATLSWSRPFDTVLDWSNPPFARWFVGGALNVAHNCVDRHVAAGLGDRVAIHWVGEPDGDVRDLTYSDLQNDVARAANALTNLGVEAGDGVAIYLPMVPEAVISMLACARIGAPHTVVFGGFSAEALAARLTDFGAKVVITADGGFRRGAASALKPAVDEARRRAECVETVVVLRRTGQDVAFDQAVDVWWHDAMAAASPQHQAAEFDAEHPLFVMYTSGTTGSPKGILHTTGGYLTAVASTHRSVFDLDPGRDVYWCTADIGWITGHSYIVYGPLANGATQVIYEGTPDSPAPGRWWDIVERYGVTILYTAPTAIRAFMKQGRDIPDRYDLSSLRVLGSVGEPINPEAYRWYRDVIGCGRAPVVDTWWQTETGSILISPLPGLTTGKPGSATRPLPGVSADIVDDEGTPVANGSSGLLVVTEPWPSMARNIWGDDARFIDTYWSRFATHGYYFAGDGARKDLDGDIWITGRVDDVMNVSGHRLSTAEIESALVAHPDVAEAAVVGAADPDTGQAVVAYVILRDHIGRADPNIETNLSAHVRREIGPIATPRQLLVVPELPKTRSGKIMRRLLRDLADHRVVGDTTTLADASVIDLITAAQGKGEED